MRFHFCLPALLALGFILTPPPAGAGDGEWQPGPEWREQPNPLASPLFRSVLMRLSGSFALQVAWPIASRNAWPSSGGRIS